MRSEQSNVERVQRLRPTTMPASPAAFDREIGEPDISEADVVVADRGRRGGFLRTTAFLLVMAVIGSGSAVAWKAAGAPAWSDLYASWSAFASRPSPETGAAASTTSETS